MGAPPPLAPNPYAPPPPPPATPYPPLPARGSGQGSVLVVRLLGMCLALALVLSGAVGVVSQFFRQNLEESTVFAGQFHQVVAEVDVGDVWVHEGAAGQPLVVRRVSHWSFRKPTVEVTGGSGVVTATGRCGNGDGGVSFGDCSVDLDITVPHGTAVEITSRTGDARADGLSGVLTTNTTTGDITLRGLRSPQVTAVATTGDVTVAMVGDPQTVQARSSTGDVHVSLPDDGTAYRVNAGSAVGGRSVKVPTDPTSTRGITATASVGDVTVDLSS
jgi:Putative adhesin